MERNIFQLKWMKIFTSKEWGLHVESTRAGTFCFCGVFFVIYRLEHWSKKEICSSMVFLINLPNYVH